MNIEISSDEAIVLFELLTSMDRTTMGRRSRSSTLLNATPFGHCLRSLRRPSLPRFGQTTPS